MFLSGWQTSHSTVGKLGKMHSGSCNKMRYWWETKTGTIETAEQVEVLFSKPGSLGSILGALLVYTSTCRNMIRKGTAGWLKDVDAACFRPEFLTVRNSTQVTLYRYGCNKIKTPLFSYHHCDNNTFGLNTTLISLWPSWSSFVAGPLSTRYREKVRASEQDSHLTSNSTYH